MLISSPWHNSTEKMIECFVERISGKWPSEEDPILLLELSHVQVQKSDQTKRVQKGKNPKILVLQGCNGGWGFQIHFTSGRNLY